MQQTVIIDNNRRRRHYGCCNFLFDVFMIVITGGFRLVWIFVREMRSNG